MLRAYEMLAQLDPTTPEQAAQCRVPLRLRSGKIGPSTETGCISCASCDKGAPIWWNSTLDDTSAGGKRGKEEEEVDDEIERRAAALRGDLGGGSDAKRARTDGV